MKTLKNARYKGSSNRFSQIDLTIPEHFNGKLIVFLHGYMGYKDWGAWNLLEDHFTSRGFGFCKFNFTHNGGTVENGIDFPDLAAFADNSYSKEVADVGHVLDWLESEMDRLPEIHLLGHSRGGGIALLSAKDRRVSSVISLAGICSVAQRFSDPQMLSDWKANGVRYVMNQRTKQQMPHHYSQVEDFRANSDLLDIEKACRNIEKPVLAIHGDRDVSVSIDEGKQIASWTNTDLYIVKDADHVFGATQPWKGEVLPEKLEEVCGEVLRFLDGQR